MEHSLRLKPILVVGGTGKTGRRLAQRLQAMNLPVRIGSRHASLPFDWENQTTWNAVLDNTTAAYITYAPDLAFPGADALIATFARKAMEHGLERLVLLSGRGEVMAQQSELAFQQVAPQGTVLRADFFCQNFSEGLFLDAVRAGFFPFLADAAPEPFVDVEDIADVAAIALTEAGHEGRTYTLSGPRALSFRDAVQEISRASGHPIHYEEVTPSAYTQGMVEAGVPQEMAHGLTELFSILLDGRNSQPTDDIPRLLGRPARDFAHYAEAVAATGIWSRT